MSSDRSNQDVSRALSELTKELRRFIGDGRSGGHRAGARDGGSDKWIDRMKDQVKQLKDSNKALEEIEKNLTDFNKGVRKAGESIHDYHDAHTDAIKGVVKDARSNIAINKLLTNQLDKLVKSNSIFGKSIETAAKNAEHLDEVLEKTGEYLGKYSDILDKASESSLSSIKDQNKLKQVLEELSRQFELSQEVQELIRKKDYAAAAAKIDADAKQAAQLRQSVKKTANTLQHASNATNALVDSAGAAARALGVHFVQDAATLGGSLALIGAGAKELYKQFWDTASHGFGGAFMKLSFSAISLGINLEALTKITKENMNLVGKMGLDGFVNSLKDSRQGLMQLGLSAEEAARTSAVLTENAFLTGVDIKNKKALNNSQETQIKLYEDLRSTTGESIETLAQQTKAIINNNDSMKIMQSMNKQQRVQLLKDINLERARLTTMGLSNDAAMEVVKTMQSMKNDKTLDKFDQANNLQAAGNMAGIDSTLTNRVAMIMTKTAAQRTAQDDALVQQFAQQFGAATGKLRGANSTYNQNIQADTAESYLGPHMLEIVSNMGAANLDRGLTPAEKAANKRNGEVSAAMANISGKIESVGKLLESPLTKIAIGVGGLLVLVGKMALGQSSLAGKALGAGKSIFGGGGRGVKGAAGAAAEQAVSSLQWGAPKKKVASAAASVASGGLGELSGSIGIGGALKGAAKVGLKALPFIGLAVGAFETITGAFDGVSQAAEIFGKEANKDGITTGEKISAGIAGALNGISFGLIPTEGTAKLFNDIGTKGLSVLTDYLEEGVEWIVNDAVPAIYDGLKSVIGFIGKAIITVLNPMNWIDWITSAVGGIAGFVSSVVGGIADAFSTIFGFIGKGLAVLGVSLAKGVVKIGTDLLESVTKYLPEWMIPDGLKKLGAWAGSDTKFSDFDTKAQAEARKDRQAARAARSSQSGGDGVPGGVSSVSGVASVTGTDTVGLVNGFGQALTAEQLAAQGIQGMPGASVSPSVSGVGGTVVKDAAGNVIVNNTTSNTSSATASKSQTETLLSDIRDKMTELVDLTNKSLTISQDAFKMTTSARLSSGSKEGFSPSLADFMNMAIWFLTR